MPEIGIEDANQVVFRISIYGIRDSWGGKGARPRPSTVSGQEYRDNWDLIFGKKGDKNAKNKS